MIEPIAVECATNDQQEIQRVLQSVDRNESAYFKRAIKQIPRPYEAGYYRVRLGKLKFLKIDKTEIINRINAALVECNSSYCHGLGNVPHETLQELNNRLNVAISVPAVLALVTTINQKAGFVLTENKVYYYFESTGGGSFGWADIAALTCYIDMLEVYLRDGKRIRIPNQFSGIDCESAAFLEQVFHIDEHPPAKQS